MDIKDLIIIGGGPAGYTCAIRAAQLGREVTLIEKENLGGICLNWGCIPTKSLLRHAKFLNDIQKSSTFGVKINGYSFDFSQIMQNSRSVATKLEQGVKYLMKKNNVEVIYGHAKFADPSTITVEGKDGVKTFKFKNAVLAVGARPKSLPFIDVDGETVHNYRTILANKNLPKSLAVIGAGAIGLEFSYFFASLGCRVTLIEALDRIAPLEDPEISVALSKSFESNGIRLMTSCSVRSINKDGSEYTLEVQDSNGNVNKITSEMILIAVGVTPNSALVEPEKAGILVNKDIISVNENYQTTNPLVYAIGDCIGAPMLAHKASHEGIIVAEILSGHSHKALDKEKIPSCIYTEPQVASIGLTEEQAKAKGHSIKVLKFPLTALGKAVAIFETDGFCKVIIDSKYGEILGVHMIGPEVTEIIATVSVAKSHEAVAESIIETVFPHPTLSEMFLESVAAAVGRPINF